MDNEREVDITAEIRTLGERLRRMERSVADLATREGIMEIRSMITHLITVHENNCAAMREKERRDITMPIMIDSGPPPDRYRGKRRNSIMPTAASYAIAAKVAAIIVSAAIAAITVWEVITR